MRWEQLDWTSLRPGVIHGDANDHNVLAEPDRMTGLLDFGDMVHSAIVCDLAVALAYAMLGERDPLAAAGAVIRGYHRHNPLDLAEQLALDVLVRARLAASLCYAAHNKIRDPDDPYQVVSEAGVRALFERLDAYPCGRRRGDDPGGVCSGVAARRCAALAVESLSLISPVALCT